MKTGIKNTVDAWVSREATRIMQREQSIENS